MTAKEKWGKDIIRENMLERDFSEDEKMWQYIKTHNTINIPFTTSVCALW